MIIDVISRQAIYAEIEDWIKLSRYYHPKSKNDKIPIDELRTRIKNIPSLTPNDEDMAIQYQRGYIDGFKECMAAYEIQKKRCVDCNHFGKLSLDCGRCDDDCSMFEQQKRRN